jgi:anti-anti-sigma regulatory factor/PAS domain-containing protein
MKLRERLAALETSAVPTWVFDAELLRQWWANARALELWRADSLEEFLARDYSDMSASTRARMQGYLVGFAAGRSAEEEWTLYPRGKPVTMKLFLSGVPLDDGRTGVLIQAFPKDAPEPDLVRSIEALRHTSVMVTLLDAEGALLLQNPAAQSAFGPDTPFAARFEDDGVGPALLSATREGEVFTAEVRARAREGIRWHALEARRLIDPATGQAAILVHQTDETDRRGAEEKAEARGRQVGLLEDMLAVVEKQREEILALSAPILEVGQGTLLVPVIGALDDQRSAEIEARLLEAVVARGATRVILDLTGSADADVTAPAQVARLSRALGLVGARPIVTGIPPALARAMAVHGADLGGVSLRRSLREGIEESFRGGGRARIARPEGARLSR